MRRQVTTTEVRCDLCERDISRPGAGFQAGPLDFCWRCRQLDVPCQACGSLSTFPKLGPTWAGNCLVCWRLAMELPRGKCSAVGAGLAWMADGHQWHFCGRLANHPDAHHCPDCDANWGLR